MDKLNKKLKGSLGIFLYKLSGDILFLLLLACAILLVSEGIIPGLVGAYLSFTRLTLLIFAVLGAMIYLGRLNGISFEFSDKKTVSSYGLLIFSVILIVNSLLKFTWLEIGTIAIASIFLLVYLHRNFKAL